MIHFVLFNLLSFGIQPGNHWYHPHNHGSVSHQLHFGLFGAIIVEYPSPAAYPDIKLYTDGGDDAYITNTMVFSSVYAVNTNLCSCAENVEDMESVLGAYDENSGAFGRCSEHGKDCFLIYSTCFEFCAFDIESRTASGLEYYVNINGENNDGDGMDQFVLVNGQFNPTLEITVGKVRRMRFINVLHQYYLHYKFQKFKTII